MNQENFDSAVQLFMARHPFKPFTIEMHGGTRFEVDYPGALLCRRGIGKGIYMSPGGAPIYFDHDSVTQIIDAPAHAAQ